MTALGESEQSIITISNGGSGSILLKNPVSAHDEKNLAPVGREGRVKLGAYACFSTRGIELNSLSQPCAERAQICRRGFSSLRWRMAPTRNPYTC